MTQVILAEDCGNSPKNLFVKDLTVAVAKCDTSFISSHLTDDARWNLVGERLIEGRGKIIETLEKLKDEQPAELHIQHIATHGKAGAAHGKMKFANGKTVAYCHVYEFSNTKGTSVKEIISFEIETK